MACVVRERCNKCHLIPENEGKVLGKARQVHPPPALIPAFPQQWVLDYGRTSILDLVAKSSTESRNLSLVVASDTLKLSLSFGMEL